MTGRGNDVALLRMVVTAVGNAPLHGGATWSGVLPGADGGEGESP